MTKSVSYGLVITLLLLVAVSFSSAQQKCNPQDQIAINQIKTAFGVKPTGDCCDWEPVVCDNVPPYRVLNLQFVNSNISGQIPSAVGDLSDLGVLMFYHTPNLTGNIPTSVTKLTNLATLTVSFAALSGPIPNFIPNLKNLTYLDLSFNALTGSIPSGLSTLPNLQVIHLERNKLTGTIPDSFGNFPKSFQFLSLNRNFLTGTIPKSLGNLNLSTIDLSRNNFTGDASFLFGKNKITQDIYLQRNNFTFDLSKIEFPSNLRELNISHNNIFGTLPKQLIKLDLLRLNVSYNNLCGAIPQGGNLQRFGVDSYFHNKCLCGAPLPACKAFMSI